MPLFVQEMDVDTRFMSVQSDRIAVDSRGRHALTVGEGPSGFSGRDEEFVPPDVSVLNIMERVHRHCKWTAPKRTETRLECG